MDLAPEVLGNLTPAFVIGSLEADMTVFQVQNSVNLIVGTSQPEILTASSWTGASLGI